MLHKWEVDQNFAPDFKTARLWACNREQNLFENQWIKFQYGSLAISESKVTNIKCTL